MKALPKLAHRVAAVGATATLIFGLAACGGSSDDDAKTDKDKKSEATEPAEEEEGDDAKADGPGSSPDWATPVTEPGEKLVTVKAGDVTVDVYQVDVVESPKESSAVDKETKDPIIAEGDDIVFVNFVITNTGDPIDLGPTQVAVEGKYVDWKYLGGMPSITDSALFEKMDVNDRALESGKNTDPPIYTFGTNETFSYGTNFLYQKGSPITFKVEFTPVDDQGERIKDEKHEAEEKAKIK